MPASSRLSPATTPSSRGLDEKRILVPEIGAPVEIAGSRITAVPSAHTELERDPKRGYPYLGYVLE